MIFLSLLLGIALGIEHFPSKYGFGDEIAPYELEDLTALEEYVRRPDPHFRYELWDECSEREATYTIYCFKMWSQQWLNERLKRLNLLSKRVLASGTLHITKTPSGGIGWSSSSRASSTRT